MSVPALLGGSPYVSYLYSYPHKTAYRPLEVPEPLGELWAREPRRDALFLYLHIPFCEMRCGFCNLFTTVGMGDDFVAAYVDTLVRQAMRVRRALDEGAAPVRFARLAVGGGTPTLLDVRQLARVLDVAADVMGADPHHLPVSVETSPETATRDKLELLVGRGVDRISIGVQSFFEDESRAVNRPQRPAAVTAALDAIRAAGVRTLNVDLMYGLPGQTAERWLASLRAALRWRPEEVYLYPLYVRPLTTLGKKQTAGRTWDDLRLGHYRLGRDFLLGEGYRQVSMRMFRAERAVDTEGPVYCCQEDGMVGLGCGARSYTERLHYATEYAVGARGVQSILADYVRRDDASFARADFGIRLDDEDRRRRHVVLSLLSEEGLDARAYRRRFGTEVLDDLPALSELPTHELATWTDGRLRLTAAGIERSDAMGSWLCSSRVQRLMEASELR